MRIAATIGLVGLGLGSMVAAHPSVDEVLALTPAEDGSRRASLLLAAGRLDEAARAFSTLDSAGPTLLLARARLELARSAPLAAVELLAPLVEEPTGVNGARALVLRARALAVLGRRTEAAADLDRAFALIDRPSPELVLGRMELATGAAEALGVLEQALDRIGPVPSLISAAVQLDLERGAVDDALALFERLLPFAEQDALWLVRRAELLRAAGRPAQARSEAERAWAELGRLPPERRSTAGIRALEHRIRALAPDPRPTPPLDSSRPPRPPSAHSRVRELHGPSGTTAVLLRGPYLQLGTRDRAVVRWRTDELVGSRVSWGPAPHDLPFFLEDETPRTEHELAITGLEPGTTIYYAIGLPGGPNLAGGDPDHRFRTAPADAPPGRIWVIGDSGTGDANAAAVRDAFLSVYPGPPPDLWLLLGDNAYPDGTDAEYQAALFDHYPTLLRSTFAWPVFGNHDGHSSDSATQTGPFFDQFTLPTLGEAGGLPSGTEAYYAVDWGALHLVVLDSSGVDAPSMAMRAWLADDLASTDARFLVAAFHHPPYSKGSHDSDDPGDSGGRLFAMREEILPLLELYGVDLVLTGHSHSYERSVLLDGHYGTSDTLAPEMILDPGDGSPDGDGPYLKSPSPRQGAVYAVAGSSGRVTVAPLDHPVMTVSLAELGSMVLDFDGDRLLGRFLDASGVFRDLFAIDRDPSALFLDGFETGAADRWDGGEGEN